MIAEAIVGVVMADARVDAAVLLLKKILIVVVIMAGVAVVIVLASLLSQASMPSAHV